MQEMILLGFLKKELFRIKIMYLKQKKKKNQKKTSQKKIKDDYKNFFKYIENESKSITYELFEKHFNIVAPTVLAKNYMRQKIKRKTMSQYM